MQHIHVENSYEVIVRGHWEEKNEKRNNNRRIFPSTSIVSEHFKVTESNCEEETKLFSFRKDAYFFVYTYSGICIRQICGDICFTNLEVSYFPCDLQCQGGKIWQK